MTRIETYHEYDDIPGHLRRQWCRMHLQRFPHVPRARQQWRRRTQGVLCMLLEGDTLLSWCMYLKRRKGLEMYTYTRRSCRGQGHGKRIAWQAKLAADKAWPNRPGALFFPHDDKASALYVSLGYYQPKKTKLRTA